MHKKKTLDISIGSCIQTLGGEFALHDMAPFTTCAKINVEKWPRIERAHRF